MDPNGADQLALGLLLTGMACVWFLPTIVAVCRRHRIPGVVWMNLLGLFLLIPWFVALAWALGRRPQPIVLPPPQVVHHYYHLPEPQPELAPVGNSYPEHDPWQFHAGLPGADHRNN